MLTMRPKHLVAADTSIAKTRAMIVAARKEQASIDATIVATFDRVVESKEKLRAMLAPGEPWR